jgi:hypothetical protein
MRDEPTLAGAYQAIGRYFCAFSALERELGEAIKVIFRLRDHEASDAIVAAFGNALNKINLVWTASLRAKKADGSETPNDWKEKASNTMTAILRCNDERNELAHSFLEPKADGSVELARFKLRGGELKGDPNIWTQDKFNAQVEQMTDLMGQVQSMTKDLSQLKIPSPETWMSFSERRQISSRLWDALDPHIRAAILQH